MALKRGRHCAGYLATFRQCSLHIWAATGKEQGTKSEKGRLYRVIQSPISSSLDKSLSIVPCLLWSDNVMCVLTSLCAASRCVHSKSRCVNGQSAAESRLEQSFAIHPRCVGADCNAERPPAIFVVIAQFVFALHSQTPGNFFLRSLPARCMELPGSRWPWLRWRASRLSPYCRTACSQPTQGWPRQQHFRSDRSKAGDGSCLTQSSVSSWAFSSQSSGRPARFGLSEHVSAAALMGGISRTVVAIKNTERRWQVDRATQTAS